MNINDKLIDLGGTRSRAVIKTENFSVVVPEGTTQTKFMMPDLPNLRNARIFGIETLISSVTLTINDDNILIDYYSKNINNIILPNIRVADNSFVTFIAYNGKEFLKNMPYSRMINQVLSYTFNNNVNKTLSIKPVQIQNNQFLYGQRINFPKSYVEINSNDVIKDEQTFAYNFIIYYADDDANESSIATSFGNKS